jgi:PIN domain nuclease of toxin-antitoxin system
VKLRLDACAFFWYTSGSDRLSATAKEAMQSPKNELFLSVASIWEMALKYSKGKLALPEPPHTYVPSRRAILGIAVLELREDAALYSASLPFHHPDPFDRMLVCQSLVYGLPILSPDSAFARYGVRTIW